MRKLLVVSTLSFLAACGSSSTPAASGGGGLSGNVGGRPFAPVEVRAISAGSGSTPCPVPLGGTTVPVGLKAIALEVASYTNTCGDYGGQCKLHQNAQSVTVVLAKLNPAGTEPALGPGTYAVYSSLTTVVPEPPPSTLLDVGFAGALGTDPTCVGTLAPSVAGGTVRLDQVTGPVTGHLALTFADGSSLSGDFSAPLCPGPAPDVCMLASTQALCTLPPSACGP
jgi:hypothetical protein